MSQKIPFLLFVFLAAGCFGSHGAGDEPDTCDCCGIRVDRPADGCGGVCDPFCRPMVDAGTDAGTDTRPPRPTECDCCGTTVTIPAGESCLAGACDPYCLGRFCNPHSIDLVCDFSHVPANREVELPVQMFGCFCESNITCSGVITGDHALNLRADQCETDALCGECEPVLEGRCSLPPLSEGRWLVTVNDVPSFELSVTPEDVLPERGAVCLRSAEYDADCGVLWPAFPYEPGLTCHPLGAHAGDRVPITVTDSCTDCGALNGPCKVDVFDDVIRVQPTSLPTACDVDCPAICISREEVCYTPRLEPGVWRVIVGDYESELVVSDGDEPPPPGDVCGPVMPL